MYKCTCAGHLVDSMASACFPPRPNCSFSEIISFQWKSRCKLVGNLSEPSETDLPRKPEHFRRMRKRKPVPRSDLDFGSPTGFRDQRGSYKDVAARDRARRSKNLSSKLQVQLLARYATLKVGSNGKKEGVRDLCEEFAVDKDYVTDHLLFRGLDADRDMEHKVDARKPTIFTEASTARSARASGEWRRRRPRRRSLRITSATTSTTRMRP